MNLKGVKEKALELGIKIGKMKKAEAVHAIQEAEGNEPCYCTGMAETCGQESCCFREDCV